MKVALAVAALLSLAVAGTPGPRSTAACARSVAVLVMDGGATRPATDAELAILERRWHDAGLC